MGKKRDGGRCNTAMPFIAMKLVTEIAEWSGALSCWKNLSPHFHMSDLFWCILWRNLLRISEKKSLVNRLTRWKKLQVHNPFCIKKDPKCGRLVNVFFLVTNASVHNAISVTTFIARNGIAVLPAVPFLFHPIWILVTFFIPTNKEEHEKKEFHRRGEGEEENDGGACRDQSR